MTAYLGETPGHQEKAEDIVQPSGQFVIGAASGEGASAVEFLAQQGASAFSEATIDRWTGLRRHRLHFGEIHRGRRTHSYDFVTHYPSP